MILWFLLYIDSENLRATISYCVVGEPESDCAECTASHCDYDCLCSCGCDSDGGGMPRTPERKREKDMAPHSCQGEPRIPDSLLLAAATAKAVRRKQRERRSRESIRYQDT
jgi:hypothetical protein